MQDMTVAVCNNIPYDTEGKLIDTRDNNTYWVARLWDGNCWMTQNLDLDLNNRTLTTANSDVASDWVSTTGTSTLWKSTDATIIKYYNPGLKYCNTSGCNLTSSANNGHDAQGNYYSWGAATAGTGNASVTSGNASSSICPKGWQLPPNNGNKSYFTLLTAYGNNSGINYGSQNITDKLLYFVYGGFVGNSSLSNAGSYGYYWSSTAYTANNAYNLYLDNNSVRPNNSLSNIIRYLGESVRCVAR